MRNSSIFKLGVFCFFFGVAATFYMGCALYRHADFVTEFYPFSVVSVTLLCLLLCAVFIGRTVYPLFQLYQYKLFYQREGGRLSEAAYQSKLAQARNIKWIYVCTIYLSCWTVYPLLLYVVAYLCMNQYVLNLPPVTHDFFKK